MTRTTKIGTEDFIRLAVTFSEERVNELTTTTEVITTKKISQNPTVDFAQLSAQELKDSISTQKNKIETLKKEKEISDESLKVNKENSFWSRLGRTGKKALGCALFSMPLTVLAFFVLGMSSYVLVVPALIYLTVYAAVFLSVFVLSAPLIWFFASKNNQELTKQQEISVTLEKAETLLKTLLTAEQTNSDKKNEVPSIEQATQQDNSIRPSGNSTLFFPAAPNGEPVSCKQLESDKEVGQKNFSR